LGGPVPRAPVRPRRVSHDGPSQLADRPQGPSRHHLLVSGADCHLTVRSDRVLRRVSPGSGAAPDRGRGWPLPRELRRISVIARGERSAVAAACGALDASGVARRSAVEGSGLESRQGRKPSGVRISPPLACSTFSGAPRKVSPKVAPPRPGRSGRQDGELSAVVTEPLPVV